MSGSEGLAAWLREAILERRGRAEGLAAATGGGNWQVRRHGYSDYGIAAEDPCHGPVGDPIAGIWREDVAYWVAGCGPQDVIARCEAELGILDLYEHTLAAAQPPLAIGQGRAGRELRARDYLDAKRELAVLEPVVRLLGTGYKHRTGYQEEWAP